MWGKPFDLIFLLFNSSAKREYKYQVYLPKTVLSKLAANYSPNQKVNVCQISAKMSSKQLGQQ